VENTSCDPNKGLAAKAVCWLHGKAKPLCNKDSSAFDRDELIYVAEAYRGMLAQLESAQFHSEGCTKYPHTRADLSDWVLSLEAYGFKVNDKLKAMIEGRLTPSNEFGIWLHKIFSYGTSCDCCLGYRVLAISGLWCAIGALLF
jgi:hypothetical protein